MNEFLVKHLILKNIKNNKVTKNKYLLFSSIGDKFDCFKWTSNDKLYDIIYIYYGNNINSYNKYKKYCDFILKNKGSKFQNLYFLYKNYKFILDNYEYIFILDDDLILSIEDINKMFNIISDKNLYIIGPSFINNYNYKCNWHINMYNKYDPDIKYTNFVEVNAPLMKINCLYNLFNNYDNNLIGWGIDFLYHIKNGVNLKDKYAIINIICKNPINNLELNTNIKNYKNRNDYFKNYCKDNNINLNYKIFPYKPIIYN